MKKNKKEEQKLKLQQAKEDLRATQNGAMILYGEYLQQAKSFPLLQKVALLDDGHKFTKEDLQEIYLSAFIYPTQARPVLDYIHTRIVSDMIPHDSDDSISEYIDNIFLIMKSFDKDSYNRDFLKIGTLTHDLLTDKTSCDFYNQWEENYQKSIELYGEIFPADLNNLNPYQKKNLQLLKSSEFMEILQKINPELSIKILYDCNRDFVASFRGFPKPHIAINAKQILCCPAKQIFSTLIHESCHHEQRTKEAFNDKYYFWARLFYTKLNSFAYLGNPLEMQAFCRSRFFSYFIKTYQDNPSALKEALEQFKQTTKIVPEKQEPSPSSIRMIKEQLANSR